MTFLQSAHAGFETDQVTAIDRVPPSSGRRGPTPDGRPIVRGKFLFVGETKLYLRGVTYGTFRPGAHGDPYPSCEVVEQDFPKWRRTA